MGERRPLLRSATSSKLAGGQIVSADSNVQRGPATPRMFSPGTVQKSEELRGRFGTFRTQLERPRIVLSAYGDLLSPSVATRSIEEAKSRSTVDACARDHARAMHGVQCTARKARRARHCAQTDTICHKLPFFRCQNFFLGLSPNMLPPNSTTRRAVGGSVPTTISSRVQSGVRRNVDRFRSRPIFCVNSIPEINAPNSPRSCHSVGHPALIC